MYLSFDANGFRCFNKLPLHPLTLLNLITGNNNVGKTALLEAIFVHSGGYRPDLLFGVNAFRGLEAIKVDLGPQAEAPWASIFKDFDTSTDVTLSAQWNGTQKRTLRLRVLREPEDLAKAGRFLGDVPTEVGFTQWLTKGSAKGAHVLEQTYQEGTRVVTTYMIVDQRGPRSLPIPPAPPVNAFFQGARGRAPFKELAERFGNLQKRGDEERVLGALQLIEPELRSLTMVFVADQPILHGRLNSGHLIPLPLMGEGMVRLADLVIAIGNCRDGVVLVDEIENGLHYSVLPALWKVLAESARFFNTQLFCTTHSRECVVAAHTALSQMESYDLRLHRLERRGPEIHAFTYDQEKISAAVETNFEVR